MKFILFLSLPLYALDQVTKFWIRASLRTEEPHVVVPGFFSLVSITNTGAAFGSFKNNNAFFVAISCLALLFVRRRSPDLWRQLSLGLLLAGVLGNLTDRLLHGHVIDFLLFDLHMPFAHPWPAFNIADSCITLAVLSFIIHSFRQTKAASEPQQL
jgi:signal peptidase II